MFARTNIRMPTKTLMLFSPKRLRLRLTRLLKKPMVVVSLNDPRNVAVKIIDIILNKKIGLSSADLPDTAIFADGLDGIEEGY